MIKVYGYKKCSTVLKSMKFLKGNNFEYDFFDFVKDQLDKEVLLMLLEQSSNEIDDFFNKKGVVFRELKLKDKLPNLTYEQKVELLLSDGKLLKRPIITINHDVIIGFDEERLKEKLKL